MLRFDSVKADSKQGYSHKLVIFGNDPDRESASIVWLGLMTDNGIRESITTIFYAIPVELGNND